MMRLLRAYIKEHMKEISLYVGFMGVFWVIFYLYGLPMEAVRYAFFLSLVWLMMYGMVDFIRYVRHHASLMETERGMDAGLEQLSDPQSLIEADYQRMLESLYQAKREMESENRISRQEMTDYYSMWVHQIKTPLAAMHVLLQSYSEEHPQDVNYSKNMRIELFKVEQYVEMVLTFLRMEEMSADLAFEEYSLDDIIKQAIRKYSQMFILQGIRLNYEPLKKMVLTDEKWLLFVIEQILSNALKYTKSGSISIYLEEGENVRQGNWILVIEDTGIGIQPEDLPRVFEKGFTGYNGRIDKKSTGIGLYLCKSVMDKLRHKIWIESKTGIGTKVCFLLERKRLESE